MTDTDTDTATFDREYRETHTSPGTEPWDERVALNTDVPGAQVALERQRYRLVDIDRTPAEIVYHYDWQIITAFELTIDELRGLADTLAVVGDAMLAGAIENGGDA